MATKKRYVHDAQILDDVRVILANMAGGLNNHEDVDISSTDHTATMTNCRYIMVTTAGNVKVDYTKGDGSTTGTVTVGAAVGIPCWVANVTKVYKTGTTAAGLVLCQ